MDFIELMKNLTVAVLFGAVNILLRPPLPKYSLYIIEMFISITFATLVGVIMTEQGIAASVTYACTAASALLARDFLTFVMGFGDYVTDNKEILYKRLFKYIMSKKD